jgi:pyruvate/2-oxoglutarate dehydrogenase complex dihydrolipoamide acyltransferase (E2) component
MSIDVNVPEVGESIQEVQILAWKKQPGDWVEQDEDLVEIETEKATVTIPCPSSGTLAEVVKGDGEFAEVGDVIARITERAEAGENQREEEAQEVKERKPAKKPQSRPSAPRKNHRSSPIRRKTPRNANPPKRQPSAQAKRRRNKRKPNNRKPNKRRARKSCQETRVM